jgi:cell division septum initiation protein DivIVA
VLGVAPIAAYPVAMREEIVASIEALTEEVEVLRDAIDELREELQWAVRNERPLRITSMSADPCAKDFRINAVPKETIDRLRRNLQKPLF